MIADWAPRVPSAPQKTNSFFTSLDGCSVRVKDLLPGAKVKVLTPSKTWCVCTVLPADAVTGQIRVQCDPPSKAQEEKDCERDTVATTSTKESERQPEQPARKPKQTIAGPKQRNVRPDGKSGTRSVVLPSLSERLYSLSRSKSNPSLRKDDAMAIHPQPPLPSKGFREESPVLQPRVRIALYAGAGTSLTRHELTRVLRLALDSRDILYSIDCLTAAQVAPKLTIENYDIVIFPGGKTSAQIAAMQYKDIVAVQAFVSDGGGFIGTCAGGVLALERFNFFGNVFQKQPWDRGMGNVQVEFTKRGLYDMRMDVSDKFSTIFYGQGPIIDSEELSSEVSILATYRSEISSRHTEITAGEMLDTPAVVSTRYGLGRVLFSSPHPELAAAAGGEPRLWKGATSKIASDMYYGFLVSVAPEDLEL